MPFPLLPVVTRIYLCCSYSFSTPSLSSQPLFLSCANNRRNSGRCYPLRLPPEAFVPLRSPPGVFKLIAVCARSCHSSIWSGCFCKNKLL